MSANVFQFVGGPFDGQTRQLEDHTVPMPVWGHAAVPGPVARLIGHYTHGTGAKRGKMLWSPAPSEHARDTQPEER